MSKKCNMPVEMCFRDVLISFSNIVFFLFSFLFVGVFEVERMFNFIINLPLWVYITLGISKIT